MIFGDIYGAAIAQVVSLTQTERVINVNEKFVKAMVNAAYHRIERAALWKFSEAEDEISAEAGTQACQDLPDDFNIPLLVWDNEAKDHLEFHDERQKMINLGSGIPSHYGMWDGELRFFPTPSSARTYTLRYYKTWPDLVTDAEEPIIPETWHDMLVSYAAGRLAQRLPPTGDRFLPHSLAQPFLDSFELDLERMKESPLVMTTWDRVPNYGFEDEVLTLGEW